MRFRTHAEATAFIKLLVTSKIAGVRGIPGMAELDSSPAWVTPQEGPNLDGSDINAVYLSYMPASDRQKQEAMPAKLAGVKLEIIKGRLIDVRRCQDGTSQVLFTNGLRDADGKVAYRGPNVDKGILCALAVGEELGESVNEIVARVPQELIDKLQETKEAMADKSKAKALEVATATLKDTTEIKQEVKAEAVTVTVTVSVTPGATVIKVPAGKQDDSQVPSMVKLK